MYHRHAAPKKRAWIEALPAPPLPEPTFREFLDLTGSEVTYELILAHVVRGRAIGPVRLGMTRAELEAAGLGEGSFGCIAGHGLRQHELSVQLLRDDAVTWARYVLSQSPDRERYLLGEEAPWFFPLVTERLRELLGEPTKRHEWSWRWSQDGVDLRVENQYNESFACVDTVIELKPGRARDAARTR